MPRLRRIPKQRIGEDNPELRALLLRPWRFDFFDDIPRLGGRTIAQAFWDRHRRELLVTFDREVRPALSPDRDRCEGQPLGWHLFEVSR